MATVKAKNKTNPKGKGKTQKELKIELSKVCIKVLEDDNVDVTIDEPGKFCIEGLMDREVNVGYHGLIDATITYNADELDEAVKANAEIAEYLKAYKIKYNY